MERAWKKVAVCLIATSVPVTVSAAHATSTATDMYDVLPRAFRLEMWKVLIHVRVNVGKGVRVDTTHIATKTQIRAIKTYATVVLLGVQRHAE